MSKTLNIQELVRLSKNFPEVFVGIVVEKILAFGGTVNKRLPLCGNGNFCIH